MKVEFSNNGVTDSLTGAPAPRNFFENLAREISKSRRKYQPLAIMTFKYLALEEKLAKKNEAEKEYYKGIFVDYYGEENIKVLPHYWQPKWINKFNNFINPSATILDVYE